MQHFYEKNIVEIKIEYTTYLLDILTPCMYEGIKSVYAHAEHQYELLKDVSRENSNIKNPDIKGLFRMCLKDVQTLNQTSIEIETNRIKESCKCSDWFDDLVKAVVKSYIILLTYNASGKTCKIVQEKYHEKISIFEFIHKCYIECSYVFYNNPELFCSGHDKETTKICKNTVYDLIRQSIITAIYKILPIKQILQEYLSNDYIVENKQIPEVKNGFSMLVSENNKNLEKKESLLLKASEISQNVTDIKDDEKIKKQIEQVMINEVSQQQKNISAHENQIEQEMSNKNMQNISINNIEQHIEPNIEEKELNINQNSKENNIVIEKNDENISNVNVNPQNNIENIQQKIEVNKKINDNMINDEIADKVITDYFNNFFNDDVV